MDDNMKEVYFYEFCPKCIHADEDQTCEECHNCLNEPARQYSHKPLNFKESD